MTRLAVFLATAGYCGYFPIAPGHGRIRRRPGRLPAGVVDAFAARSKSALIALTFAAGTWAATHAERFFGGIDPGPVVIDEVLGMLVTLAFIPVGWTARARGLRPLPRVRRDQAVSRRTVSRSSTADSASWPTTRWPASTPISSLRAADVAAARPGSTDGTAHRRSHRRRIGAARLDADRHQFAVSSPSGSPRSASTSASRPSSATNATISRRCSARRSRAPTSSC